MLYAPFGRRLVFGFIDCGDLGLGGISGPPIACSTPARASWLTSKFFLYFGFIMDSTSCYSKNATSGLPWQVLFYLGAINP